MIHVRDTSGASLIGAVRVRDAAGLATIATARIRSTDGLSVVYSSASAAQLQPDYVGGFGYSTHPVIVTTDTASVSSPPTGASFAWVFSDGGWSAIAPTSSSTQFRKTVAAGNSETTTVYCAISVNGKTYNTNPITAEVSNGAEGN